MAAKPAPSLVATVTGLHPATVGGARRVAFLLSILLLGETAAMTAPLVVAIIYGAPRDIESFATTMFITGALGAVGFVTLRTGLRDLTRHDGIAVVALGWLMVCLFGAIPYVLEGQLGPLDAWFETVSGFTGTGASTIPDVEAMPRGLLFWRCYTHWLGAMGFLVAFVALLPLLGIGAMQLYRAEAPGLEVDRLRPRISSTARILWTIYLTLSVALTVLLLFGGMDWYDALCQMFAAIGTGGFSTKNTSIGWWHSAYIDWVIVLFLWLSSTNFSLYWFLVSGRPGRFFRDAEWRFYTGVLVCSSFFIAAVVWATSTVSANQAIRDAFFAVVSLASTTGFVTADYEKWAPVTQFILFMLLFMGGCAGSTAGAMKAIRVLLFGEQAAHEFFRSMHPYGVTKVRLNGSPVTGEMMRSVSAFMGLYLGVYVVSVAIVSLTGPDFATAMSAVATAMGGVGPGLGDVGPMDNFLWMAPAAKIVLTFNMLAGRLELVTLMVMLTPAFWRR
jgi:trk system potassium uptake protein TrkH